MEPKSVSKSVGKTGITTIAAVVITTILIGSIVGGAGYVYSTQTDAMVSELKSANNRLSDQVRASQKETAKLSSRIAIKIPMGVADDDDGKKIRATGIVTFPLPNLLVNEQFVGDVRYRLEMFREIYTGTLEGEAFGLTTNKREAAPPFPREAHQVRQGHFEGTLGGSEPGSFTFNERIELLAHEDGRNMFKGWLEVIPGSGMDGLEGICGGGTFTGATGTPTTYDYTFRFGKDCKANN